MSRNEEDKLRSLAKSRQVQAEEYKARCVMYKARCTYVQVQGPGIGVQVQVSRHRCPVGCFIPIT